MSTKKHTTNSRDSGEPEYDPLFSIYPLEVVLPPKLPLDAKVPFSYYLGLGSQKSTKREHNKHGSPQRITSFFYFVDLNSLPSYDNDPHPRLMRLMDKRPYQR
ncbi:20148_t:CDS:2 [Cetraspora pellucida]|uniref:20148_t:CDS:1 n=1 Tax=Cetraspora pellucida TaxID=1433469 RepID=A0A9N9I697_9GLOM|nr:20148_t:CDS:2 [Cetraspora pellucida]